MGMSRQAPCTLFGVTFWPKNCSAQLVCEQMPAQLTSDSLPPTSHHGLSAAPREGRDEAALQGNCARCRNTAQGRRVWALAPGSLETTSLSQLHAHTDTDTCTSMATHVYSRAHVDICVYRQEHLSIGIPTLGHAHTGTCIRIHACTERYKQAHVHSAYTQTWTHTHVYTDGHVDTHSACGQPESLGRLHLSPQTSCSTTWPAHLTPPTPSSR